ncbi:MAG: tRNA adenosine(34) deaminase TadA [Thermodesulfobacteriota bacterium]
MDEPADVFYMKLALAEAERAAARGEVPGGAVLVGQDGAVLAQDGNRPIELHDPTGHAEMLVLRRAGERSGNYRLPGSTLYVTVEPCVMCAGALVHARVARLVFGARDPKAGGVVSCYPIGRDGRLNHDVALTEGVLAEAGAALLRDFFRERRKKTPVLENLL